MSVTTSAQLLAVVNQSENPPSRRPSLSAVVAMLLQRALSLPVNLEKNSVNLQLSNPVLECIGRVEQNCRASPWVQGVHCVTVHLHRGSQPAFGEPGRG